MQVFVSPDGTSPRWAWTEGLEHGPQREIAVPIDWPVEAGLDRQAADLLRYIGDELSERDAHAIAAGETLAYGWTTLGFRDSTEDDAIGPGMLVVCELADPLEPDTDCWIDGAGQALTLLAIQTATKRRNFVRGEIDYPHRQDSALICKRLPPIGYLWDYPLAAERQEHADSTISGWFFACADEQHNHDDPHEREEVTLLALIAALPRLFPYLALPVGTALIVQADAVVIFRPGDDEGYIDPGGRSSQILS